MDSYFDMPAGYNDADLEMAALEDAGRRAARRYRGFDLEQRAELAAGRTVTVARIAKDTGARYLVMARARDTDELGPCDFTYSINGLEWHASAKAARLADAESSSAV